MFDSILVLKQGKNSYAVVVGNEGYATGLTPEEAIGTITAALYGGEVPPWAKVRTPKAHVEIAQNLIDRRPF